jgi:hypothetical protein
MFYGYNVDFRFSLGQLPGHKSSQLNTDGLKNAQLTARILPSLSCSITATGDRYLLAEIVEQIRWLALALRSTHQGAIACSPSVQDFDVSVRSGKISCSMTFEFEKGIKMPNASHEFYSNSGIHSEILVRGYPIRTGLTIGTEKVGEDLNAQDQCYGSAMLVDPAEIHPHIISSGDKKHVRGNSAYKKGLWTLYISRCLSWSRTIMRPRSKPGYRRIEWKCVSNVFRYWLEERNQRCSEGLDRC